MAPHRRSLVYQLLSWVLLLPGVVLTLTPARAQDEVAANPAPIFQQDDALQVRIEAPFQDIFRSRGDAAEYFPATLYYSDSEGMEVATTLRIKTRGNFRNREDVCSFPPLMLDFPRGEMGATIFNGENRLKLVTHCQQRSRYYEYVLLEYLNYRVLNLLTDYSLKVRLLEVNYVNTDGAKTLANTYGFLLEDIERMAERLQLDEVELKQMDVSWYDEEQEVLVALFQYLLGNTDWSLVLGDPDEACCHNVYPLQGKYTSLLPVPYDFDVTGIVSPSYGSPAWQLGVRSLGQRLYRGACPSPAALQQAVALFMEKRDAIRALYEYQPGLGDFVRNRTLNYVDSFFAVIADQEQVQKKILDDCRSYNE
jgi:hypothetical protein